MPESLEDHLHALIQNDGPVSVATFMAEALGNPRWGYYQTKNVFGRTGDFTTAPEISQMFGELLGLWCAQMWSDLGRPTSLNLVELGPGRGTLMRDALRAMEVLPECLHAIDIHLVESSARLRKVQRDLLAEHTPGTAVYWHDRFDSVPGGPLIVIANEFFDALPIHQYQKCADGWHERLVGLGKDPTGFTFALSPAPVAPDAIPKAHQVGNVGSISESCPVANEVCTMIATAIRQHGGAGLFIDYGTARSVAGDSLQALRAHEYVDVLSEPGTADLTAHVDFERLAAAAVAAGAMVFGPILHGVFLNALGIEARAAKLAESASTDERKAIEVAVRRLTGADEMGELFKVLGLSSLPNTPAGF